MCIFFFHSNPSNPQKTFPLVFWTVQSAGDWQIFPIFMLSGRNFPSFFSSFALFKLFSLIKMCEEMKNKKYFNNCALGDDKSAILELEWKLHDGNFHFFFSFAFLVTEDFHEN